MYFTHHFSRHETLSRAHSWLTRLGFDPDRLHAHTEGTPRLAVNVPPSRHAEFVMLLNAVERSDPDGWPSFWKTAQQSHPVIETTPAPAEPEVTRPRTVPIGWHPVDNATDTLPHLH